MYDTGSRSMRKSAVILLVLVMILYLSVCDVVSAGFEWRLGVVAEEPEGEKEQAIAVQLENFEARAL